MWLAACGIAADGVDLEREASDGFSKSSFGKHVPITLDDVHNSAMKRIWAPQETYMLLQFVGVPCRIENCNIVLWWQRVLLLHQKLSEVFAYSVAP